MSLAVASRLAVFLAGYLAVTGVGFSDGRRPVPPLSESVVLDLPARWDASWYIGLASGGYRWDGRAGRFENIAFFPAYPGLVGAVARALGVEAPIAWDWVGVAVSTAALGVALWLLVGFPAIAGQDRPRDRAWLLLAYPFAIFFGLPYTESLYLAASLAAFACFERRQDTASLVAGVVAGLTRPTGVTLSLALAVLALRRLKTSPEWRQPARVATTAAAAAGPLLGAGVYSLFIFGLTGHPLTWAGVQAGWGRATVNPVTALLGPLGSALAHPWHAVSTVPHDVLNLAAAVAFVAAIVPVTRRLGPAYGLVVASGVLMPLAGGGVASTGRYTAVLFPVFLWLPTALTPAAMRAVLAVFVVLQVVAAALFFTWRPLY